MRLISPGLICVKGKALSATGVMELSLSLCHLGHYQLHYIIVINRAQVVYAYLHPEHAAHEGTNCVDYESEVKN